MKSKPLPYRRASSGKRALRDMGKIVSAIGASAFGHMEDFDKGEVIVQFKWRERVVSIRASAKVYAAIWLNRTPVKHRASVSRIGHERRVLKKVSSRSIPYCATEVPRHHG